MPRDGLIVPAETSVLCEGCGYTLDGLPGTGQCPECGLAITMSTRTDGRALPVWERYDERGGIIVRFLSTTVAVTFRPRRFYRTLATRREGRAALRFARVHWLLSAIGYAGALSIHAGWYRRALSGLEFLPEPWVLFALALPLTYLSLWAVTRVAGRLTAWEASYRGYRLPLGVILRVLYYHAAHFLPVAVMALATTAINAWLRRARVIGDAAIVPYLYVLCGEVLVGAAYLFKTYWTGMRNTMYANR